MAAHLPLVSILIPVYNEAENIQSAYDAIVQTMSEVSHLCDFEILFTDNSSSDGSFEIIRRIAGSDPRVRGLRFNRNYGFQRSLLTAYRHCSGEAAIQIDADLQDPPAMIPLMIEAWLGRGADVVYGLRVDRQESAVLRWARSAFYKMLARISDDTLPTDAGDFRLTNRLIIDQISLVNDYSPYVRGLISSLAVRPVGLSYTRRRRERGQSKFPFFKLVAFGIEAVLAHSILPLRIAVYLGVLITLGTCMLLFFYFVRAMFFTALWPEGFSTLVVLQLLTLGANSIFFGVIGEYVGRIYLQSRIRPLTVIEDAVNLVGPRRSAATPAPAVQSEKEPDN